MEFKVIFYIVVFILWAVYNGYKKMQKEALNKPPAAPAEQNKTIITDFSGKQVTLKKQFTRPAPVKPAVIPRQQIIKKRPAKMVEPMFSDIRSLEKTENVETVDLKMFADEKPDAYTQTISSGIKDFFSDEHKFDLKRALIYSEILKRPAY